MLPAVLRILPTVAAVWVAGSTLIAAQAPDDQARVRPRRGDRVAIAVFTNITGSPEDRWIGQGIAETLSTDFERLHGLTVVLSGALSSVDERAMLDAARGLGAQWVVGGAYQRAGDLIRITAQIVRVDTASVARTAKIDGAVSDLFALQDRVAAELVAASVSSPRPDEVADDVIDPVLPSTTGVGGRSSGSGFAPPMPATFIDGPPPPVLPNTISRDEAGRATIRTVRLVEPLALDGRLDEAVYGEIAPVTDFIQQLPDEGAAATEKTEAWIFFDDEHVWITAKMWDSAPEDEWVANDMRRDSFQIINNDNFSVMLDTFYDRRNGVAFMVNPIGGFFDYEISDEGNPNSDWNPVWDVRTGRFDQGWTLEMRVPFKSLRYQRGVSQLWGIQFARRVMRKNESSHLTAVSIAARPGLFRVSAAATLVGLEMPLRNTRFEVKPYGIGSLSTDLAADAPFSNKGDGDFGVDAKWGVTQSLIADFTYNTDFAQVEVDQQQVNLTRFSLFFPEKREFFLESRGTFDFGSGPPTLGQGGGQTGARGSGPPGTGAGSEVPIVFFSRRIGLQDDHTVPIVAGGRLSGKLGQLSVGAVNIQTDDEPAADALATNFTVVRLKQDVLRRSRVGGIYTRRSVSLEGDGSNEAYGFDGAFSFYDNVHFNGYYARTRTPGFEGDDASYQGAFTYSGDLYGVQVDHLLVGDNFNPEVGFLRRDDFRRTFAAAQYSPRPRSIQAIRQFTFGGSVDYIENGAGQVETRAAKLQINTELENSDRVNVDFLDSYELLVEPFEITSDVTVPVGGYGFRDMFVSYRMGQQRPVSGTAFLQRGQFFDGTITAFGYRQGRVEVTRQMSVEPTIAINQVDLPAGAFTATVATGRVTYTFTPRMFFSGLVQYNSTGESVGTNLRFRWEYQPGSELFVVFNDQRDTSLRPEPTLETRAFIVKFTKLFRF